MKSLALLTMIFLPATFISVMVAPLPLFTMTLTSTGPLQHDILYLWR